MCTMLSVVLSASLSVRYIDYHAALLKTSMWDAGHPVRLASMDYKYVDSTTVFGCRKDFLLATGVTTPCGVTDQTAMVGYGMGRASNLAVTVQSLYDLNMIH